MRTPGPKPIILYGSPTCVMVSPVRGMLKRAQAPFIYVDIARDTAAKQQVRQINDGNESVPTLVFADGSTLTEPSTAELAAKLASLGFEIARPTLVDVLVENRFYSLLAAGLLLFGLYDQNMVFVALGLFFLAYVFVIGLRH